jgi:hypothetical protein
MVQEPTISVFSHAVCLFHYVTFIKSECYVKLRADRGILPVIRVTLYRLVTRCCKRTLNISK